MTSVAAIVPTRDRAALCARAVASVLAQTRPPDEVVVVDDGSEDGTAELLRARFAEVEVLETPPRGVSAARNRGIRATSSEWLAFLDSDDEWLPEKLETQVAALNAAPDFRLCHSDEIWIRNGRRVNPRRRHRKRGGFIFRHCLPLCAISPSAAVVHRSLFERVGLFDETLPICEDYDLWLRICARWPVLYVDRPLVIKHGGHADQLSRTEAPDRYRIRALAKALETGGLAAGDRRAAAAMLDQKITIYLGGVSKRGREAEARALERLRQRLVGTAAVEAGA